MGLLQEGILAARLKPNIHAYLTDGQSGYVRDVEDVMLALFEFLSAQIQLLNRCPWICFGDFRKAFPSTDRADLLCLLYAGALVRDGMFVLLDDILGHDKINIWLSGCGKSDI